jgi:hypothetical protein
MNENHRAGDHVLIGLSDPFPKNKNVNQAVLEKCRSYAISI